MCCVIQPWDENAVKEGHHIKQKGFESCRNRKGIGVPLEIVSKVILRHANLSTTQKYLRTISDVEAIRRIENVYG